MIRASLPPRPPRSRRVFAAIVVIAAITATAAAMPRRAAAQSPGLDEVEATVDRGEAAAAREALDAYVSAHDEELSGAERARISYLRGRLMSDPDSAEVEYLRAAIDGEGAFAVRARLRLAQLALARGDHERAAETLERLRTDHPGADLVAESWVWTARAAEAAGDAVAACAAWDEALASLGSGDPAREQASRGVSRCHAPGPQPGEVETFTVQLGAFGTREAAMRLRDGAAMMGVAVRVVAPAGGVHVYRVRAGRFGSREDAARLADRFHAEGFEAIVVPERP